MLDYFRLDIINFFLLLQESIEKWLLTFITQNTIGFICLVLFIHSFILKTSHHSLLGAWSVNILGVFFHELAHAMVGFILRAKPDKFVIIPSSITNSNGKKMYVLGHVDCTNLRWYNAFPVSLAPIILLCVAYGIEKYYWYFVPTQTLFYELLYVYLLITFILNAMPSSVDIKEGFRNIFGIILWVCIIVLFLKWFLQNFSEKPLALVLGSMSTIN